MWLLDVDHYLNNLWNPTPYLGKFVCPYEPFHGFDLNCKILLSNFCNPYLHINFTRFNKFVLGRTILNIL